MLISQGNTVNETIFCLEVINFHNEIHLKVTHLAQNNPKHNDVKLVTHFIKFVENQKTKSV